MTTRNALIAALSVLCFTGCSHVFSPPARVNMLESSAVIDEGDHAIAVVPGATRAVWGFNALSLTGTYKQGIGYDVEIGADANVIMISNDSGPSVKGTTGNITKTGDNPIVMSGRIRGKWAPSFLGENVALTGGLGGGYAPAGGGFISPDFGIILAYENRYLVPYLGLNTFVSQPIGAKPVDVGREKGAEVAEFEEAQFSWGYDLNMGLKLPIQHKEGQINLHAGIRILVLFDEDTSEAALGFMLGPEFVF